MILLPLFDLVFPGTRLRWNAWPNGKFSFDAWFEGATDRPKVCAESTMKDIARDELGAPKIVDLGTGRR